MAFDSLSNKIRNNIYCGKEMEMRELLNNGLDPNFGGGWPLRLAARLGCCDIVRCLIQYGANPHLLGEAGASSLQLAVFSAEHWDTDKWSFLLSCCDSSQLADGAAVAIVFRNIDAFKKILETGRCNTNLPTTLTGKTVDFLSKSYKLQHLVNSTAVISQPRNITPTSSPRISRASRSELSTPTPQHHRNLSPSVAHFFHQSSSQRALTPTRPFISPTQPMLTR